MHLETLQLEQSQTERRLEAFGRRHKSGVQSTKYFTSDIRWLNNTGSVVLNPIPFDNFEFRYGEDEVLG